MAWAVLAGALFIVLAFLVTQDRAPLDAFDVEGRGLEDWADDSAGLVHALRVIEVAFGTIGMTILSALLAVVLFVRRQRWAALVVAVVMAVTSLATTGLKTWLGRDRRGVTGREAGAGGRRHGVLQARGNFTLGVGKISARHCPAAAAV